MHSATCAYQQERIMKKIDTIIHPQAWDQTRAALETLNVSATLREVKTFGRTPPKREVYRGSVYMLEMTPELELSLLVQDELLESTLAALEQANGDAEIVVTPVEYLVRARGGQGGRRVEVPRAVAAVRSIGVAALAAPALAAAARG
jgi:nitrogen regulatory protein P-II 1